MEEPPRVCFFPDEPLCRATSHFAVKRCCPWLATASYRPCSSLRAFFQRLSPTAPSLQQRDHSLCSHGREATSWALSSPQIVICKP
ncbi:protein kinase [Sesbania bispinosa]|nr:protein kinase [Sesbania bispinosa]